MSALAAQARPLDIVPGARILAFPGADCPTVAPASLPGLTEADRAELDRLRWFALRARLSPRPDLERACFLFAAEDEVSLERTATAFFHGLTQTATRPVTIYKPGTRNPSDDEIWLIRVVAAYRDAGGEAAKALITWRVRPEGRRWLRFLADALARSL